MIISLNRRRAGVVLAVAVLLAGLGAFGYWWSHPTLFTDAGSANGYDRPVHVGTGRVTVGLLFPPASGGTTVRLRSASAHFAPNSAGADATFQICTGPGVGLVLDPAPYCHELHGLPAALDLQAGSHQSLIMTLTPTSAGQVTVDAISLDYSQGGSELWQRGSQSIPVSFTFPAAR